jgi:hypothetical protein
LEIELAQVQQRILQTAKVQFFFRVTDSGRSKHLCRQRRVKYEDCRQCHDVAKSFFRKERISVTARAS